jgi:hypothetical protein
MERFYKVVSVVFLPLFIPTYGMLLLISMDIFSVLPFTWKCIAVGGTAFFTCLLPLLPMVMMIKRGDISNVMISKKEERTIPYLFTFFGYFFWTLFLWRNIMFPPFLLAMAGVSAISILIVIFINLKWQISAHMSAMGGLVGAIIGVSYRLALNPVGTIGVAIFLSALVGLARLELKAHTPAQVVVGFLLSFLLVLLPCFYY